MASPTIPLPASLTIGIPFLLLTIYLAFTSISAARKKEDDLLSDPVDTQQLTILPGLPLPSSHSPLTPTTPNTRLPKSSATRTANLKPLLLRLHPSKQSPLPREFYDLPPRPSKTSATPSVVELGKRAYKRGKVSLGYGEASQSPRPSGSGKISDASSVGREGGRGVGNASMPGLSPEPGHRSSYTDGQTSLPSASSPRSSKSSIHTSLAILSQSIACSLILGMIYLILVPRHLAFDSTKAKIIIGMSVSFLPVGMMFVTPLVQRAGFAERSGWASLGLIGVGTVATVITIISTFASSYALIGLTGGALLTATVLGLITLTPIGRSSSPIKLPEDNKQASGVGARMRQNIRKRDKHATRSFFSGDLLSTSGNLKHLHLSSTSPYDVEDPNEPVHIIGKAEGDVDAEQVDNDGVAEILAIARTRGENRADEDESWIVGTGDTGKRRDGPKTLEELKAGDSWLSSPSRMTEGESTGPSCSYDDSHASVVSPITKRIRNIASASHHLGRQDNTPQSQRQTDNGDNSNSWLTSEDSKDKATTMSPWSYATAEEDSPERPRGGQAKLSLPASHSGYADEPSVIRNYDPADMTSASENERFSSTLDILPPLPRRARVASDSSFYSAMEYNNQSSHSQVHPGDQKFPRSVSESFSEDDMGLPVARPSLPAPDDLLMEELEGGSGSSDEEESERVGSRYARSPSPIGLPPMMALPTLPAAGQLRRSTSFDEGMVIKADTTAHSPFRSQKPSTDSDQTIMQLTVLSVNSTAQDVPPSATGRYTPYSQSPMSPMGRYGSEKFSTDPLLTGTLESVKGPRIRPGSQLDIRWDQLEAQEGGEASMTVSAAKRDWRVLYVLLMISAWSSWALAVPVMFKVAAPTEIALVLFAVSLLVPAIALAAIVTSLREKVNPGGGKSKFRKQIRIGDDEKQEGLSRILEMSSRSIRPDSIPQETKWAKLIQQFPSLRGFGYRNSSAKYQGGRLNWEQVDAETDRPLSRQAINKRMSRPSSAVWVEQGQAFSGRRLSRAFNYVKPEPRLSVLSSIRSSGNFADGRQSPEPSRRASTAQGYPMESLRAVSPLPSAIVRSRSPLGEVAVSAERHAADSEYDSDNDTRRETFKSTATESPDSKSVRNARVTTAHRAKRSHSSAYLLDTQELPTDLLDRMKAFQTQDHIRQLPLAMIRETAAVVDDHTIDRRSSLGNFGTPGHDLQTLSRRRTMDFANRLSGLFISEKKVERRSSRESGIELEFLANTILPELVPTIKVRNSTMTLRSADTREIIESIHEAESRPSCSTYHESVELSFFRPSVDFVRPEGSFSHGHSTSLDFGDSAVQSTPVRALRHRATHSRNASLPHIGGPTFLQAMRTPLKQYGKWEGSPITSYHEKSLNDETPRASVIRERKSDHDFAGSRAKEMPPPLPPHHMHDGLDLPPFPAEFFAGYSSRIPRTIFPRSSDDDLRPIRASAKEVSTTAVAAPSAGYASPNPLARIREISEESFNHAIGGLDEAGIEALERSIENGEDAFVSGMFDDALESGDVSFTTEAAEVMEQIMMSSGAAISAGKASTGPFAIGGGKSSLPADAFPSSPRESIAMDDLPGPTHFHDIYASMTESEEWARVPTARVLLAKKSSDTMASRATASSCVTGARSPTPSPLHTRAQGTRKGSKPPIGSSLAIGSRPGSAYGSMPLPGRPSSMVRAASVVAKTTNLQVPKVNASSRPSAGDSSQVDDGSKIAEMAENQDDDDTAPPAQQARPVVPLGERSTNGKSSLAPTDALPSLPGIVADKKSAKGSTTSDKFAVPPANKPVSILKSRSGGNLHNRFVNDENVAPLPLLSNGMSGRSSLPTPFYASAYTSSTRNMGRKKMSSGPGLSTAGGNGLNSKVSLEAISARKMNASGNGVSGSGRRAFGVVGGGASGSRSRSTSPVKVGGGNLR